MGDEFRIDIDTATGRGTITIGHDTHDTTAGDIATTRNRATEFAKQYAAAQGRTIAGTAYEDNTPWPLTVSAQGIVTPGAHVESRTVIDPEADAAPTIRRRAHAAAAVSPEAPQPSWEQAATPASAPSPSIGPSSAPAPEVLGAALPAPAPEPVIEDTDPAWLEVKRQPATEGWKGTLNGLGLKLSPSEGELAQRRTRYEADKAQREADERAAAETARIEAEQAATQASRSAARAKERADKDRAQRRAIQTNFQGTRTVLVANPKGGSRKTTSTYLTAATMGIIRGGSVIAWDANETMGTLGRRSQQDLHTRTVVDLLQEAAPSFTSIEGSRLGRLDAFVRPQGDSHFDVLASDEDATRQDLVDGNGFGTIHEILSRFYRMIFVDTGNNIRVEHFLAAIDAADQLVIPVAASRDSVYGAEELMRALEASGHGDMVEHAVVLIHDLKPRDAASEAYAEVLSDIAAKFEGKVAAIVPVPFDAALENGDEIAHEALAPATRDAYQEAAAAIANSLRVRLIAESARR